MTRLLPVLIAVTLVIAFLVLRHEHHSLAAVPSGPFGRSAGVAQVSPSPVVTAPAHHRGHLRRAPRVCTDQHWKRTLKPAERYIDAHESGLNPNAVEPTTHAYGLGQLLPSTYANLGLPMTASPCQQIAAARAYAAERYGSYANARRFWEVHSWW